MHRRRAVRPNSRRALVFLAMVLSVLVWAVWELGRTHTGRLILGFLSLFTFLFFALGWALNR